MNLRLVPALVLVPLVAACADLAGGPAMETISAPGMVIGAGAPGGTYGRIGTAICDAVATRQPAMPCRLVASEGSVENLQALHQGSVGFALTQSDTAAAAQLGVGPFRSIGPDRSLRSVLALGIEPLAVVVRADSGITTFGELKGKRIDPGPDGSGTELTVRGLILSHGWTPGRDIRTVPVPGGAAADALCSGRVDAVAFIGPQPDPAVEAAASACSVRLLPVGGPVIEAVVVGYPIIERETIAAGTYSWQEHAVPTVGLQMLLATTEQQPAAAVRAVVEGVAADLDRFRRAHPSLRRVTPRSMLVENDVLPVHSAAVEAGTMAGIVSRDELMLPK